MVTIRQRWLAADLQRLRKESDLPVQEVADRLGISKPTVHRIERGAFPPKEHVLRGMLNLYKVGATQQALILDQWQQAKAQGWWIGYYDIVPGAYVDLEGTASRIRSYQGSFVPGLLQTEEYARATIEAVMPGSPENLRRVELRALRRTRFNQRAHPPELHAILDEAVVRRQVGGAETMRDQVGYLKKVAERPNVTIQIVPFSAGEHVGMVGPRVTLSFANRAFPDVVYLETPGGDLFPEGESTLSRFDHEWSCIDKAALPPKESVGFLADLLEE